MKFSRHKVKFVGLILLMVLAGSFVLADFAQAQFDPYTGELLKAPDRQNQAMIDTIEGATEKVEKKITDVFCSFSPTCWLIEIAGGVFKAILWLQGVIIEALAGILFAIVKYNSFVPRR